MLDAHVPNNEASEVNDLLRDFSTRHTHLPISIYIKNAFN